MDSILRSIRFPAVRRLLVLLGIVSGFAVMSFLIGQPVQGAGQKPLEPNASFDISGNVHYCPNAGDPGVNAVTVQTTSGAPAASTSTNASGNYTLTVASAGPYTVAPSKPADGSGISTTDATQILQHLSSIITLSACKIYAGDTTKNGSLSTTDASHILNFLASNPPAANNFTGQWRANPEQMVYVSLVGNVTNQNYEFVRLGDVTGNGSVAAPQPGPKQQSKTLNSVQSNVSPNFAIPVPVTLPTASVGTNVSNFSLPILIGDTTPGGGQAGITGYRLRVVFNPSIVTLQPTPVDNAMTLSSGFLIIPNSAVPGVLIVTAAGAVPLTGSGVLLRINFTRNPASTPGQSTALTFQDSADPPPPENPGLQLEDANEAIVPSTPVNGSISISNAPTAVHLASFKASGYDNGVHLNWNTGFEAENLGFNIYREVAGKRTLVTPDIIAGSALMTGSGTRLEAGQSYGWWDQSAGDLQDARYWLEEIDVNGSRTMHGPFDIHRTGGQPPRDSQAALLSQLGRGEPRTRQAPLSYAPGRPEMSALSAVSPSAVTPNLASMRAVKMAIKEEGWYRVGQQELATAGLDLKADSRRLQLYTDGVEQPMLIAADGAVEFFATGQDSLSTDTRVYWLVNGDRPGKRVQVLAQDGTGGGALSFPYTAERRDRSIYFSSLRNGDTENFFGQVITASGIDQTVSLPHLDSTSGGSAQVEIALQGAIDLGPVDHQVRVQLNGADLGRMSFGGLSRKIETFAVGNGLLRDGDNVFTLTGEVGNRDISLVDYIRVTYPRVYTSDQDSLRFTASGSQTIDGFSNAAIRVFDITDPSSVVEVTGTVERRGERYAVGVTLPGQGTRTLLALTEQRIKSPASISANQASRLRTKKNKAVFVIIAQREFFPALQPLKSLRESQGLSVALVDIEDIYDEFSNGVRTPHAVKDFLSFATTTWKKKPRFVLLAGHASLDPKNHLGFGDSDLVPTRLIDTELMETASDDWFGDFDGDGLSELAVGRLPFRTTGEAETMVSKIVSYDSSGASNEALFVADGNDGFDFEAASAQLRGLLPSSLKTSQLNRGRMDPDSAKVELVEAINRGQKFVNYLGHGSVNLWRGNLLTNEDALSLSNTQLPLFVMMTCLNGYFHDAALDSLGESLLRAERGGAVAVWTSSGMTAPNSQEAANRELYRVLFGQGQKLTLGEAVMRAKASAQNSDVRSTWILLGDPTMRIK